MRSVVVALVTRWEVENLPATRAAAARSSDDGSSGSLDPARPLVGLVAR